MIILRLVCLPFVLVWAIIAVLLVTLGALFAWLASGSAYTASITLPRMK